MHNDLNPIENPPRELIFPPALVGSETDQELRARLLQLVQSCSHMDAAHDCPLRSLKGLSHVTLKDTLNRLPRESVLAILQEELDSQAKHNCGKHPGQSQSNVGAA